MRAASTPTQMGKGWQCKKHTHTKQNQGAKKKKKPARHFTFISFSILFIHTMFFLKNRKGTKGKTETYKLRAPCTAAQAAGHREPTGAWKQNEGALETFPRPRPAPSRPAPRTGRGPGSGSPSARVCAARSRDARTRRRKPSQKGNQLQIRLGGQTGRARLRGHLQGRGVAVPAARSPCRPAALRSPRQPVQPLLGHVSEGHLWPVAAPSLRLWGQPPKGRGLALTA